jgi:hypothetical protein
VTLLSSDARNKTARLEMVEAFKKRVRDRKNHPGDISASFTGIYRKWALVC